MLVLVIICTFAAAQQDDAPKPLPVPVPADLDGPKMAAPPPSGIRLGQGDLLNIKVYNAPDLSQSVRVDDRGTVSLPLLGRLEVVGLTPSELERQLEKLLKEGDYIVNPHVNVSVAEYATQGVSVSGEVMKPGIYPFTGPRRLFDVIAMAGGFSPKAGELVTIVRRNRPEEPLNVHLSRDPAQNIAANVEVVPGDTVLVSKAGVVYVVGDVEKPGGFVMENNTRLTVLQALALAGGHKRTAKLGKTKLIRRKSGNVEEIGIQLDKMLAGKTSDMMLEEEDILFVPNSLAKSAGRRSLEAAIQTVTGLVIWSGR
jgi:polysaccharide export outer membrane protein